MTHVLILDDIQHRHDVLRKRYEEHGFTVVNVMKYHECVAKLKERKWDLVHLDHDLADEVADADLYEDGWGKKQPFNGWHVVLALLEMPEENYPSQVIVHSINPQGAPRMRDGLRQAGILVIWEPFTDPNEELPETEGES